MRTAGDIEKQAVRGIERHQRGEAVAPFGNGVQHMIVGGFIGIIRLHVRADGAGIGQRHANRQAGMRSLLVKRENLKRVVLLGDDDAGRIG